MLKVLISPGIDQIDTDNGVGGVIHAQYKHLPKFGIELVSNPDDADVIACHIQQGDLPRVDVLMCHGLYWSGDPNSGQYVAMHHEANRRILDAARRAHVVTVPSPWVAMPFQRDMRISPDVIGHGIDLDSLPPMQEQHQGYVLWNKNRSGDACSPAPAIALAERGVAVVSTFGEPGPTMQIIGPQPHADMLKIVASAEVYLATTKETFGIGTLEALALGIPVLGYAWGGTADLVTPDCGVLVQPGDIDGLMAGLATIRADYAAMRRAARARAEQFTWDRVMAQYVACYRLAHERRQQDQGRVAVVITNYNYAQHVGGAMYSAALQSETPHELIVVDDGSSDGSNEEIARLLATIEHDLPDITLRHIRQKNQGVAAARNAGIAAAESEFIVCLDADDELAASYLKVCRAALVADRGLGVAYTGLGWLVEEGEPGPNVWTTGFNWERQATPANPPATTIHCAAMFRRSMWERAGGHQQIYAPGEDAEFWTRGLSVGYTARMVTDAPLFHYRNSPDSASKTKPYRPIDTWHPWMRDKLYPMAAPAATQPLVRSYSEPAISIIIPVGPGHAARLPAALDSLLGQTFRNWQVVVVDDSGTDALLDVDLHRRYPFMNLVNGIRNGGVGAARNLGLSFATAPLVLFLDADDYLIPTALQAMLERYMQGGAGYVYSDWYGRMDDGTMELHAAPEYSQQAWLERGQHAVTVLMATEDARRVDGFDATMRGWEDWDFFIKLAVAGICGARLPEPLLVYQYHTGSVREQSLAHKDALLSTLRERYGAYQTGGKAMAGCCGGNGDALARIKQQMEGAPIVSDVITADTEGVARMEFIGANIGAVTFHSKGGGRQYRGGNNQHDKYHNVDPQDVEHLVSTGQWRLVHQPTPRPPTVPVVAILAAPEIPQLPAPMLLLADEPDGMTPEQEAAANKAAADMAKAQRKRGAA